jgi:hypothetical protein
MTFAAKCQLQKGDDVQEYSPLPIAKSGTSVSGKDQTEDGVKIILKLVNTCYIRHNYFILSIFNLFNKYFSAYCGIS